FLSPQWIEENENSSYAMAALVLGRDFREAVTHAGAAADDLLTGSVEREIFVGGRGDDLLTGGGGADSLQGGSGDDTLVVSDMAFGRVDGGTGFDTLQWRGLDEPL